MADGFENRDEIFSKAVRAGKRTYFFDVKSTKGNDLYLTLTESKKRYQDDGKYYYEKHKLFLYKEDFEKFTEGLNEAIAKIEELKSDSANNETQPQELEEVGADSNYTDINFEDLGN